MQPSGDFRLWGGAYSYRFICLRDEPFDCCSAGLDGPSGVFGFSAATLEGVLLPDSVLFDGPCVSIHAHCPDEAFPMSLDRRLRLPLRGDGGWTAQAPFFRQPPSVTNNGRPGGGSIEHKRPAGGVGLPPDSQKSAGNSVASPFQTCTAGREHTIHSPLRIRGFLRAAKPP